MKPFLLEYLLNSLWQVPLLALATAVAIRLLRPGLRLQHLLWIATVLLAAILPLRGTLPAPVPFAAAAFEPVHRMPVTPAVFDTILVLYLASIVFATFRLAWALQIASELRASSVPRVQTVSEAAIATSVAACFHVRAPAIHTVEDAGQSPTLAGILRPAILIPSPLEPLTEAYFTAILAHEFAHLRRLDLPIDLALRMVAIPIAYHPATAFLQRRIQRTRELLTDRLATRAIAPAPYAQALLDLAGLLVAGSPSAFSQSFINPPSHLEERIMHLIRPASRPKPTRILAAAAVLCLAALTAAAFHLTPPVHAAALNSPRVPVSTGRVYTNQTVTVVDPSPTQPPAPPPPPEKASGPKAPQAPAAPAVAPAAPATPAVPATPYISHRELTSAERAQMDRQLDDADEQVRRATARINSPEFKQQIENSIKGTQSPEFKKQMGDLRTRLSSPEFKDQVARSMNTPEYRKLMDSRKQELAEAGKQTREIDPASIQRQLDDANRELEKTRRELDETRRQLEQSKSGPAATLLQPPAYRLFSQNQQVSLFGRPLPFTISPGMPRLRDSRPVFRGPEKPFPKARLLYISPAAKP